jgi:hypothetical protein
MKTLQQHVQDLIDKTPGDSKTTRIKAFSKSVGCGRTHLYEILAGSRKRFSYKTLKALYRYKVPAKVLFSL